MRTYYFLCCTSQRILVHTFLKTARQSFEYTSDSAQADWRLLQGPRLSSCSRSKHESNVLEGRISRSTHPGGPHLWPWSSKESRHTAADLKICEQKGRKEAPPPSSGRNLRRLKLGGASGAQNTAEAGAIQQNHRKG